MTVRQLVQHLSDTAPGTAEVLVRVEGEERSIERARVELVADRVTPVVVVHLK